jgi:murein DD-endopeptidase MepM/ murein hydrolase activator NlpD
MVRRLLPLLLVCLVVATPASADDYRRKREIDSRISTLNAKIAHARQREGVLTQEISIVTTKIRELEDDVASAQARLDALEAELALHQARLHELTERYRLERRKLGLLRRAYGIALMRLQQRLIEAYESPSMDAIDVMFSASSFGDLLDQLEYFERITTQNKQVADQLHESRDQMRRTVERTRALRAQVKRETDAVRSRADAQRSERDHVLSIQQQLDSARTAKRETLASVHESEREFLHEVDGLQAVSAELAARIRSAQGGSSVAAPTTSTPSAHGLIWPVNGPVTSPFGWRWGRMHEGIDIGAGSGTPIVAAAAGTVIYCGWMSGYGNLTVIDHGGGLATAYGHQSSIAVGCGAGVAQGQLIGYVGCTGHCFGSHLHFEVRVNGTPVDPLGYL